MGPLRRDANVGVGPVEGGKICRQAAPIADRRRCSGIAKAIISLDFSPWHSVCSAVSRLLSKLAFSELCHVTCHWRRLSRTRRHPVADFAPAGVVVAVVRLFWILLRGRQFRR